MYVLKFHKEGEGALQRELNTSPVQRESPISSTTYTPYKDANMILEPTFSPPSTTLKSNPRASPRLLLGLIENLGILESWEPPYPPPH